MLSLKFILRGRQGKVLDKLTRITLRINKDRVTVYCPTELRVHPDKWNAEKEEVKVTQQNRAQYNATLTDLRSKVYAYISDYHRRKGYEPSPKELKEMLDGKSLLDVIGIIDDMMEKFKQTDKYWEYKKFKQTRNKLTAFAKSEHISIDDINVSFVDDYQYFLKQKGLAPNTIRNEIKRLKRVLSQAAKDGVFLEPVLSKLKIPKAVSSHRTKLTIDEVRSVSGVSLDGQDSLIRDCFLFALYTGGMRFGDLAMLKKRNVNGDRLQYIMSKSKKSIDVLLIGKAREIHERWSELNSIYLLPILIRQDLEGNEMRLKQHANSRNTYFNKRLSDIMKKAGIHKTVTFHCARHTAAQTLIQSNVNIDTAREILGHSDLKVTQIYLQSLKNDQDDAMKKMEDIWR